MTLDMPGRRVAPTLEAVAAEAGVSRSTVSRVVNGSSHVSPDVLAAVNGRSRRCQWTPSAAGNGDRFGRSDGAAVDIADPGAG